MKLVEILAKELKVWPGCVSITQDYDGDVGTYHIDKPKIVDGDRTNAAWTAEGHIRNIPALSSIASDHATAIVTRADWESERARIAKPAKNADKDGWVRHRGGKCPVEAGTVIEYRERNGNIEVECEPELLGSMWFHENHPHDIMAYRLHKPAEQVEACSKPELRISLPENYGEIIGGSVEGPIQWRDRITEIDATTQALTAERADLVQKLASEGFALIGRINELLTDAAQKHEDMSDWRNWKVGDIVECVSHNERWSAKFAIGSVNVIKEIITDSDVPVDLTINIGYYVSPFDFKWHSRPSA